MVDVVDVGGTAVVVVVVEEELSVSGAGVPSVLGVVVELVVEVGAAVGATVVEVDGSDPGAL